MNEVIAEIAENTEANRWEVTVDGKVMMHTKSLVWVKSNFRKSAKLRKAGVTTIFVTENGKREVWDPTAPTKRGRKAGTKVAKKVGTSKVAKKSAAKTVRVIGTGALEGKEKVGKAVVEGKTTLIEFESKKGNGTYTQEFDTKTGVQITTNPYHIWEIAKSA